MALEALPGFQDALQRDLAWRKREISDLKSMARHAEEEATHLYRGAQVLLCAHWEGFLKKGATFYLEHALRQTLPLKSLTPTFIAAALYGSVMKAAAAKYPGSDEHHIRLAVKILEAIDGGLSTRGSWSVDTEGNPGSGCLARILSSIGIDGQLGLTDAEWSTLKVFIDEQLLRDRHLIAHGEGNRIGKEQFLQRADRTVSLLDIFAERLIDAAADKRYLSLASRRAES